MVTVISVLSVLQTHAQDPNFSQFFVSPLTLNPALTGKFEGDFRIAGNYRNQWPAISKAFITSTVSVDGSIMNSRIPEFDRWGIGIMAMTDKTANGILNNNYVGLSTAYHKSLDEDGLHQIGVGFQASYGSKRLDGTKLHFGEELDQLGGWTAPTTEPMNDRQVRVNYFDVAAGLLYNGSIDGVNSFYAGASFYHLTQPKESFSGDGWYRLARRYTIHGGARFELTPVIELHISALQSFQNQTSNTVAGAALAFNLTDDQDAARRLYLGSWLRYKDAFIPYMGLEIGDLRIGTSYDVNASGLRTASQSRGGVEISVIYISRKKAPSHVIRCPVF